MTTRATGFVFKAPLNARGLPTNILPTVPARDLGAADVAKLSDEQYAAVEAAALPACQPLYEAAKPAKAKVAEVVVEWPVVLPAE